MQINNMRSESIFATGGEERKEDESIENCWPSSLHSEENLERQIFLKAQLSCAMGKAFLVIFSIHKFHIFHTTSWHKKIDETEGVALWLWQIRTSIIRFRKVFNSSCSRSIVVASPHCNLISVVRTAVQLLSLYVWNRCVSSLFQQ